MPRNTRDRISLKAWNYDFWVSIRSRGYVVLFVCFLRTDIMTYSGPLVWNVFLVELPLLHTARSCFHLSIDLRDKSFTRWFLELENATSHGRSPCEGETIVVGISRKWISPAAFQVYIFVPMFRPLRPPVTHVQIISFQNRTAVIVLIAVS